MTHILEPENELEEKLEQFQSAQTNFESFMDLFLSSDIFVPSGKEIAADGGGMEPLLFDKNGTQMMGVFTSISRVNIFKDLTPYCISMKGENLLQVIPNIYGLVVNPGFDKGFDLPPNAPQEILRNFHNKRN